MRITKSIRFAALAVMSLFCAEVMGQSTNAVPATFIYAVKGQDTLRLDKHEPRCVDNCDRRPVFIYIHGGGWEGGTRTADDVHFISGMAERGFLVVSIDYRLRFQALRQAGARSFVATTLRGEIDQPQHMQHMQEAIMIAVEDFYDATAFVLKHSEEWNIDTTRVLIGGDSAGACTSLMAEYFRCNQHPLSVRIPKDFRYCAVVSTAGAIYDFEGHPLQWQQHPCPMMLFHGVIDQLVPYDDHTYTKTGVRAHGSKAIAQSLEAMGVPFWMNTVTNADHIVAALALGYGQDEMMSFYQRIILKQEKIARWGTETYTDGERTMSATVAKMLGITAEEALEKLKNM